MNFLFFLFQATFAFALPGDNCPSEQQLFGKLAFNRQFTVADGCLVQVTPIDKNGLVYREYVFDESGRLMVFNSVDGPYETATSQKSLFLLPVAAPPFMRIEGDRMVVTAANGSRFFFARDSAFVQGSSEDLEIAESQKVDLSSGGNFEVKSSGILLDAGWAIGDRSYRNELADSRFLKAGHDSCVVKNSEIFAFKDPFTGQEFYQPLLKVTSAELLAAFLAERCGF